MIILNVKSILRVVRFAYSMNSCLMKCQQRYILDQCACVSASLPPLTEDDVRAIRSSSTARPWPIDSEPKSGDGWSSEAMKLTHFCGNFSPIRPAGQLQIDIECEAAAMERFSTAESIRFHRCCGLCVRRGWGWRGEHILVHLLTHGISPL